MDERAWRREVRGAVHRGAGADVVAHLDPETWTHVLQLVGDGLLAALAQRVDGAEPLAAACADALRERDWTGDGELADQLDVVLGRAPTPMLRPLPVDLDDLSAALGGDEIGGGARIDLRTGEVLPEFVIELMVEQGELDEDDEADPDRWLPVWCDASRAAYRDMEVFIDTVADADRARRLSVAIDGKGAFRRFKDVVGRWPDELERFLALKDDRERGRARAWLADAGYRPVRPRDQS